ncbi:unnamed protein product [Rhizophagus irregularis]|nr:unnamed protein product [Rhizophagus irregularis]
MLPFIIIEEQEAFHSKLYDFNIPNNINDFNKSNKQYSDSEKLPKEFIKLQINSNKIIQQQMKGKILILMTKILMILMMMTKYIIIQIFIQKNKMNWKFPDDGF